MPAVVTAEHLAELRAESDRLLAVCMAEPERHANRLTWEADYLDEEDKAGMEIAIHRAIIYTYNPALLGKINENRFPAPE